MRNEGIIFATLCMKLLLVGCSLLLNVWREKAIIEIGGKIVRRTNYTALRVKHLFFPISVDGATAVDEGKVCK